MDFICWERLCEDEETYMIDFIVDLFAEIADFLITFWADNVIDKFTKRTKLLSVRQKDLLKLHARD